jgi:hypothetical protein
VTSDPPADEIVREIRAHPRVEGVELVGSRVDGGAGPLSDWDFKITASDPHVVADALPSIVEPRRPLAAFWDPLGEGRNYMAIFTGLVKLDLHLDLPPSPHVPWTVDARSLPDVDAHFWDWTLWLAGKALKGRSQLLAVELPKMQHYLLAPLGCRRAPRTIAEAVLSYQDGRADAEARCGRPVAGSQLEIEVLDALRRHCFV